LNAYRESSVDINKDENHMVLALKELTFGRRGGKNK
jgi:hypothetical protein